MDYTELSIPKKFNHNIKAYIPHNYDAGLSLVNGAKWCIVDLEEHWDAYTKRGVTFVYLVTNTEKYAIAYSNELQIQIFDQNDVVLSEVPNFPKIEYLLLESVKDYKYNQRHL